ncbi:hypothetical protein H9M94_01125 [Mycoplasma sp. Pen4]|uniref:hypothetical protein n=1 Tax=Mycoplasma sp. Pen4 TaxID=640330 RepID=UPI0016547F19|nr:hypothetical protein [Mycoplasma sp. Pen4]QNM93861.1 hypothetical protein H9M94_01125 [Mycoplasma sp. Pen4]
MITWKQKDSYIAFLKNNNVVLNIFSKKVRANNKVDIVHELKRTPGAWEKFRKVYINKKNQNLINCEEGDIISKKSSYILRQEALQEVYKNIGRVKLRCVGTYIFPASF